MAKTEFKLPRILRKGSKGRDVVALQRALRKAGYRPKGKGDGRAITREFGLGTKNQLMAFQKAHRLKQDGQLGQLTFNKLKIFYDAYGRSLVRKVAKNMAVPTNQRQRIVQAAYVGYFNRGVIHYTQGGSRWEGIDKMMRLPRFPNWADCSSFATWCYWLVYGAGMDFLNGQNWRAGYTGTQIAHGWYVAMDKVQPADLIFYGHSFNGITHVAPSVGNGRIISHGNESGPMLLPVDYRGDRQQQRGYIK
jgi:peptidoglycan hydrolase-like protein with peptidoglycan-binding domain